VTRPSETSAAEKASALLAYYAWLKDFMEAGKDRLTRYITRDATKGEVHELKRENTRLKQVVAELSLQVHVLKKTAAPGLE
jgi:transposase